MISEAILFNPDGDVILHWKMHGGELLCDVLSPYDNDCWSGLMLRNPRFSSIEKALKRFPHIEIIEKYEDS